MSIAVFFLYVVTWSLVALTPGPAVMCSMAQATRYGFRSSLVGISGIQLGNFLFFVCVALGLGTLLATARTAFSILQTVGAIYLLYLGVKVIIASFQQRATSGTEAPTTPVQRNLFLQGLLIQVTNPKALLFVSALLPQFIDPARQAVPQLAILVVATIVIDTVVLGMYALFAERGARSLKSSRVRAWLERAFGGALVFFGIKLLAARK